MHESMYKYVSSGLLTWQTHMLTFKLYSVLKCPYVKYDVSTMLEI